MHIGSGAYLRQSLIETADRSKEQYRINYSPSQTPILWDGPGVNGLPESKNWAQVAANECQRRENRCVGWERTSLTYRGSAI